MNIIYLLKYNSNVGKYICFIKGIINFFALEELIMEYYKRVFRHLNFYVYIFYMKFLNFN